jgi:hypothetical protein
MKRLAFGAAVLVLASAIAAAGEIVLPGDGFSPGWEREGKPSVFIKADLFNHIDGGADLFIEFGFERVIVQNYARGPAEISIEIYEMTGPEAALGVYLMKCGRESPLAGIAARNSSETAQFTILKGRYFVQVNNFPKDERAVPAMLALAKTVLGQVPDERPDPRLAALLPEEKKLAGSERLIRGPIALQPFFTFGEGDIFRQERKILGALAEYDEGSGSKSSRFVIEYPSAEGALEAFRGLKANLDPYLKIVGSNATAFVFQDFKSRFGLVRVSGARIEARFNLAARPAL